MKQIPDTTADQLAMLLSTDWFLPYWPVIGIHAGEEQICFQQGCREIVTRMIAGAPEYYLISFTEDRVTATRNAVQALARQCKLSTEHSYRIDELCTPVVKRHERQTTAWMFTMTADELARDERLDTVTQEVVAQSQKQFSCDSEELSRHCIQSQTKWDAYIRQLTPDLPDTLSDFVSVGLVAEAQLDFVLRQLDREQRKTLLTEYRATALRSTGLSEDDLQSEVPDGWR